MPRERSPDERSRIRREFERRDADAQLRDRYRPDRPAVRFEAESLTLALRALLGRHGVLPLGGARILEVGCGSGGRFELLRRLGADADGVWGVDLSAQRLAAAARSAPAARLVEADATELPFRDHVFDLVAQFTAFTSILDAGARGAAAREMVRVLRPGGTIVWYDFRVTPPGSKTRGVSADEIRRLYPRAEIDLTTVTLAPPLARALLPWAAILADALQRVPLLRTHHLALVRPEARG